MSKATEQIKSAQRQNQGKEPQCQGPEHNLPTPGGLAAWAEDQQRQCSRGLPVSPRV